ncbi:protein ZINC INDUCED FACILITATOR-LIKE 1-like [Carica papaya]|uniref:protein ZINC INDUCED FACILITATOR-LIKE 1-like n=1 Tax=Carica papaya TaxID=3649 RepID=UPI000B8CE3A8|nr:protein ZINC INDUCED FACILITATOR-LIKE 1-like [Carica papaya]
MPEIGETLLKRHYSENCPGCKVDQFKDTNPAIPLKLFFYVSLVVLCAALPISSLFPFLYFMELNSRKTNNANVH